MHKINTEVNLLFNNIEYSMKLKFTVIIMILIALKTSAQNIGDFFLLLPDETALGLSFDERKDIIDAHKKEKIKKTNLNETNFSILEYDQTNGYLSLTGAFEGFWEMCFWRTSSRRRIIAAIHIGCGPARSVERFDFFEYKNNMLSKIEYAEIIPQVDIDDFLKIPNDFSEIVEIPIIYKLPQKGKNIIAMLGWEELIDEKEFNEKFKGERVELIWEDGLFVKGSIK